MTKKKTEIDPVVFSAVSQDIPAGTKKSPAKRAAKKAVSTVEAMQPKVRTHRHKKQEPVVDAVAGFWALDALTPEQVHDSIAAIAYSYYEGRGYQPGSPDEDWRRAEREFWSHISD